MPLGKINKAEIIRVDGELPPTATLPPTDQAETVKEFLDGKLTQDEISGLLHNREAVEELARVIIFSKSPEAEGYNIVIKIEHSSEQDAPIINIKITKQIVFLDTSSDIFIPPKVQETDVFEAKITILEFKPKKPKKAAAKKENNNNDSSLSAETAPMDNDTPRLCGPYDRKCWDKQMRAFADPGLPACGKYIDEQQSHLTAIRKGWSDPNAVVKELPPPAEHGADPTNILPFVFGTASSPPPSSCEAEWNDTFIYVVPTLACTAHKVQYDKWHNSATSITDEIANNSVLSIPQITAIPGLAQYLGIKANHIDNSTSWRVIWAFRWLDKLVTRYEAEDTEYIQNAMSSVAGDHDERKLLAAYLREWYNDENFKHYQPAILMIYQSYFLYLYPLAVDENSLPDIEKFPVELWWATNWFSEVKRRRMPLKDAFEMLKCSKNSAKEVAVLKELLPYLKKHKRYADIAKELEAIL